MLLLFVGSVNICLDFLDVCLDFANESEVGHPSPNPRRRIPNTRLLLASDGPVMCVVVSPPPPRCLSGMNLNKRELNEHVEFESQTYYAAFAAELEACAQPMWGLLTHCKVKVSHHPRCYLEITLNLLQFYVINYTLVNLIKKLASVLREL